MFAALPSVQFGALPTTSLATQADAAEPVELLERPTQRGTNPTGTITPEATSALLPGAVLMRKLIAPYAMSPRPSVSRTPTESSTVQLAKSVPSGTPSLLASMSVPITGVFVVWMRKNVNEPLSSSVCPPSPRCPMELDDPLPKPSVLPVFTRIVALVLTA